MTTNPTVAGGISENLIFGLLNLVFALMMLVGTAVCLATNLFGENNALICSVLTLCGSSLLVSGIGLCQRLRLGKMFCYRT